MAELDFEGWYLREHPRVVSALAAITGRPSVAAEAADEAFVRACERWDHVRAMESPGGWVYQTALNDARRRLRRAGHERRLLGRLAHDPAQGPWDPAPEHWSPELWEALRSLPLREREAIALRYVADLSVAEVAEVMGISSGTAAWTLHSAHHRLARAMGEVDPDGPREDVDA